MRLPSATSSSFFPSWLSNMTITSLFCSIFGIALFSTMLLGTTNVDMLTILTASEMLPNPFDFFQMLTKLYAVLTQWIKLIPTIENPPNISSVVGALINIARLIVNLLRYIFSLFMLILTAVVGIVLCPLYIISWCINTIFIFYSVIAGTAGAGYVPYVIDLSVITNFIEGAIVL